MLHIPVLRWGEPYKSLEVDKVVHFVTGEAMAEVSRANAGLVERDMRHAQPGPRGAPRDTDHATCWQMVKKAADLYTEAELPLGDGTQTPDQFARMQSATTGLPEHMCRFNMKKNHFVLNQMDKILDSLTRGLDLDILSRGYGIESRGVPVSYQAQSPVLGLVLPSNSPGVHTLWLPIIPDADRPGPQARPAGAVDTLPHGPGVRAGRHPQTGHCHLSRPGRRRRRGAAACARAA